MNKLIRNTSLLTLLGVIALGLGGCSQPITRDEAKAEYDSKDRTTAIQGVYKFTSTSEEVYGDDKDVTTIDLDYTDGSLYFYSKQETTENGTTSTVETLIYQTDNTTAISATKSATTQGSLEVPLLIVRSAIDLAYTGLVDVCAFDYSSILFADDDDDTTREFYKEANGGLRVVINDTEDDGTTHKTEYNINSDGLMVSGTDTYTEDGLACRDSTTITLNSNFSKKTAL